ncbi:MAG: 3-keto-5-aminohexanoate cleavage protein [Proteobacteria bacterium]|nr:3-keto-5-aminohexanoate cleavage protein [Pseudomonadota bacterium]
MDKMVITCAVCGAETMRKDNPNLPITPKEIAQSTYEAYKAGASIVHLHVRKNDGTPTQDPEIFKETIGLIREKCNIVVEITTGGAVGMTDEERLLVVSKVKPEMASLDCGTINFADEYIINTLPTMRNFAKEMNKYNVRPTLECFDLSHIYCAEKLIKEGLLTPPYHYGLVLNVPNGLKYEVDILNMMVSKLPKDAYWTVMGIGGRASLASHYGAIALGGFIRVGFEDNVNYSKGVLAESNAQLVERAVKISKDAGLEIAQPDDVRKMLNIRNV